MAEELNASTQAAPAVGDESRLPLSTSSAMPDLSAATVPRLKARVHNQLSSPELAQLPLSKVRFRSLRTEDMEEMIALHTEWFPLAYDHWFYEKSVGGELSSLVATYNPSWELDASAPASTGSSSSSSASPLAKKEEECILGMITLSTYCQHHLEDIKHVLGADCEAICRRHGVDAEEGQASGSIAYILTLGVAEGFRRRGLAKQLLKRSIAHVDQNMPKIQAIYLHVVTYNTAAIQLYEATNFQRLEHFPSFYLLQGSYYDSFLYALYLHGASPPWRLQWQRMWKKGIGSILTELASSAWSLLWRADATEREANATSAQAANRA
eukprot:TRINITY_DN33415_c0_g1_i1.p1 TRINITY_DN33415_c0_g1~~TRINITY_DN33415_c0_g1_i1.p1  ORF type:complete len:325 (+),score=73.35 TRINITY_DN33415_c0_g1_i1:105-1079(+)